MRGENFDMLDEKRKLVGSPPLARGKLKKYNAEQKAQRITPACAGKTRNGISRKTSL